MKWFRMYSSILNDPKVQRLQPFLFKCWVNLLCCAAENEGDIPDSYEDIAFILRISEENACLVMDELKKAGLLESSDLGMIPHNWHGRQYESNSSTERVRRFRENKRNVTETLHETPSRARRTDSDTEEIREDTEEILSLTGESAPQAPPRAPSETKSIKFKPPTAEEVTAYMNSPPLHQPAEAHKFHDHYTANGWVIGKTPMKDWQAAARNWCARAAGFATPDAARNGQTHPPPHQSEQGRMAREYAEQRKARKEPP